MDSPKTGSKDPKKCRNFAKIPPAIPVYSISSFQTSTSSPLFRGKSNSISQKRPVNQYRLLSLIPNHINALPAECLVGIFKRISLEKAIRYRDICKRWHEVIQYMCELKRCLILDVPRDDLRRAEFRFVELNRREQYLILRVRLSLMNDGRRTLEQLGTFFTRLFPRVDHLMLGFDFYRIDPTMARVWSLVNTFTGLKRLDLVGSDLPQLVNLQHLAPTLRRMEHFSYHTSAGRDQMVRIVRHLGPGCTQCWFTCVNWNITADVLLGWQTGNAWFVANLSQLMLDGVADFDVIDVLCRRFVSLRDLRLRFCSERLIKLTGELFDQLARLDHCLTELSFTFVDTDLTFLEQLELLRPLPLCISSVRRLSLMFPAPLSLTTTQPQLNGRQFCRTLSALLPNLETLELEPTPEPTLLDAIKPYLGLFPRLNLRSVSRH